MKYGGDPIHMLNFIPHMTKKLLSVEERDWLPKLWGAIDDAYLTNTSKSINDYWEVEVIVERLPQWHDNRDKTSSGIYVAPPVALLSERVQSTHSYLNSSSSPQSTVKQKSRGSTTGDVQPSDPPMEILDGPALQHPVYELPRKTVKIINRLLCQKIDGAQEGKVTWKDVCKVRPLFHVRATTNAISGFPFLEFHY